VTSLVILTVLVAVAAAPAADIKAGPNSILVQGSGNGNVGPITFDQPYYVVSAKYESPDQFSMLQVSYKEMIGGNEIEKFLATVGPGAQTMRVFQTDKNNQPSRQFTFKIQAGGKYTIEFLKPAAIASAVAAPQTFKGGKGSTMTPLVKTAKNYVMLRIKYTGADDPNKRGGMPLASANLYDAVTGDEWVRNQNVYNHNIQQQDGHTGQKPGVYFAIVSCSKDGGTWEATITE
jgi:hypothetical protein